MEQIASQFPIWKQERFPPPRVSQSQYDKVGLTSMYLIVLYTSLSDLLDSASVDMGYVSRPSPYAGLAIYLGLDVGHLSLQTALNTVLTVV